MLLLINESCSCIWHNEASKIKWLTPLKCQERPSWVLKCKKNRLAAGALPRTLLRELTVLPLSPQTSCLVGKELTAPSPITLTPPRPFGLCRSLPPPICCKIRLWCQGSCISHETHFHIVLYSSFLQIWIILYKNQGDHLSGKPGNVREFDSCQGFY